MDSYFSSSLSLIGLIILTFYFLPLVVFFDFIKIQKIIQNKKNFVFIVFLFNVFINTFFYGLSLIDFNILIVALSIEAIFYFLIKFFAPNESWVTKNYFYIKEVANV